MQLSSTILAAFMYDPDWTFDVAPRTDHAAELVSTDALKIRCFALNFDCKDHPPDPNDIPTIHCEIPSNIGEAGCIGGSIGAVAGAAAGIAAVAALAPLAAACGILAFICLLLILLIGALIAYLGAELGALIGHAVGGLLDATQELTTAYGEAKCGSCITVEGDWVTDQDHGHNEIHDVEVIPLLVHPPSEGFFLIPDDCADGCPGAEFALRISPALRVITPGDSAQYTLKLLPLGAFAQPVSVAVESGLPPEATPEFSPNIPQALPATFDLTITTTQSIPLDKYNFAVRATADGKSVAVSARLDVIPPFL